MSDLALDVSCVNVTVHLRIEPHRLVGSGEHPKIGPEDPAFTVGSALWSASVHLYADGRQMTDRPQVTLHDPLGTDGRGCLRYSAADAPSWVPRPQQGWERAAADLLAVVTGGAS